MPYIGYGQAAVHFFVTDQEMYRTFLQSQIFPFFNSYSFLKDHGNVVYVVKILYTATAKQWRYEELSQIYYATSEKQEMKKKIVMLPSSFQLKKEFREFQFPKFPGKWPFHLSDQQLENRRKTLESYLEKGTSLKCLTIDIIISYWDKSLGLKCANVF